MHDSGNSKSVRHFVISPFQSLQPAVYEDTNSRRKVLFLTYRKRPCACFPQRTTGGMLHIHILFTFPNTLEKGQVIGRSRRLGRPVHNKTFRAHRTSAFDTSSLRLAPSTSGEGSRSAVISTFSAWRKNFPCNRHLPARQTGKKSVRIRVAQDRMCFPKSRGGGVRLQARGIVPPLFKTAARRCHFVYRG